MNEEPEVLMNSPQVSLSDLLGRPYMDAVCEAKALLEGYDRRALSAVAEEKVDLFPEWCQKRLDDLVDCVGKKVCAGFADSAREQGQLLSCRRRTPRNPR